MGPLPTGVASPTTPPCTTWAMPRRSTTPDARTELTMGRTLEAKRSASALNVYFVGL
jgi:hypothetical protein